MRAQSSIPPGAHTQEEYPVLPAQHVFLARL